MLLFLKDELKRRFIRNPDPEGTPTVFMGPQYEEDGGKNYIPHLTKKGEQQDRDVTMIGYTLVFAECLISSGVWTSLCGMFFC